MKRTLILALTLVSVLLLFVLPAGAAESYKLIPSDAYWTNTDNGGASVVVQETDGIYVFSGSLSGTWPCTETWYVASPIIAELDSYSLVYDFTVESGDTNINFFFDDGNGGSVGYTICNTALNPTNYDTGSGDLKEGVYQGALKLSDFVESAKLWNGEAFPTAAIIDGCLRFIGIQVYSVNGAKITVNAMEIVHNDDVVAAPPSEEPSEEPESSENESAVSAEESESVSEEETQAPSDVQDSSHDEVSASSEAEQDGKDTTPIFVTIIAVAAILIFIGIAVILMKKKRSQQ